MSAALIAELKKIDAMVADGGGGRLDPGEYAATTIYGFVAENGKSYDPAPRPDRFDRGTPRACYANSALLASLYPDLTYVEGYALSDPAWFPIHHAWCVDGDGRTVDVTWETPGLAYVGIEFPNDVVEDAVVNGTGSVLDDWTRGWPALKKNPTTLVVS